jgi:hypothetical protein
MAVSEDEVVRQIYNWLLINGKHNRANAYSLASLEKASGINIPRGGKGNKLINFFLQRPELFGMVYINPGNHANVYAIVDAGKDPLSLFSRDAVPRLTQDEREQYSEDVAEKEDIDNMLKEASSARSPRSPPPTSFSLFSEEIIPKLKGGKSKSRSRSRSAKKSKSKSRSAKKSRSRKNRNRKSKSRH